MINRLNEYRVLWIMVLFDIPVVSKKQRKAATTFRKRIMADGFTMFQYSIYVRHCPSVENANVHIKRVKGLLPDEGHVVMMTVTDKQFGMIEVFYSGKTADRPNTPQQLEMF